MSADPQTLNPGADAALDRADEMRKPVENSPLVSAATKLEYTVSIGVFLNNTGVTAKRDDALRVAGVGTNVRKPQLQGAVETMRCAVTAFKQQVRFIGKRVPGPVGD